MAFVEPLKFDRIETRDKDAILRFIRDNSRKFAKQFYYNPYVDEKTVSEGLLRNIEEKLQHGAGFCIRDGAALKALGIIAYSRFDSEILRSRIGKWALYTSLTEEETKLFVRKLCLEAHEMGFDALFGRTELDQTEINDVLKAATFTDAKTYTHAVLADILLTFGINLDKEQLPQEAFQGEKPELTFESPTIHDEARLKKITALAYGQSHYFNDPDIPSERAETVYQEWIHNSLKGFADLIIVAKSKQEILGYITFRLQSLNEKSFGTIDLLAVDKDHRGEGIGRMLVFEGIKRISHDTDTLFVSTQVSNLPALRLYRSSGFKPILSEATFHVWFKTLNINKAPTNEEQERVAV